MKKYLLHLMIVLYGSAGMLHFLYPQFYLKIMPGWMPLHELLVYLSGIAEVVLALLLIPAKTRPLSAWTIIAMLVVFFFAIHLPQSISYFKTKNPLLPLTLIRLPIQILLVAWAKMYTHPMPNISNT